MKKLITVFTIITTVATWAEQQSKTHRIPNFTFGAAILQKIAVESETELSAHNLNFMIQGHENVGKIKLIGTFQAPYPAALTASVGYEINKFIISVGTGIAFWFEKDSDDEIQHVKKHATIDDTESVAHSGTAFIAEIAYFVDQVKFAIIYSHIHTQPVKIHSLGMGVSMFLK